jgi:hypothetical protein
MREQMWNEHRVFIHFPWDKSGSRRADSKSKKPDDYDGFRKGAIKTLNDLAKQGGYVAARFEGHDKWLVGQVSQNSKIELCKGKWRPEELERQNLKRHDGVIVLKTLRLSNWRHISPEKFAVLQTVQPRQGTIMRWHKAGDLVKAIVLRQRPRISFDLMSHGQQEILCAEFLRSSLAKRFGLPQLECVLCDVGRSMADLDIVGIATDRMRIFAQVTHDPLDKVAHKLKALRKYRTGANGHLILFCEHKEQEIRDGVKIVPIQKVYRSFIATRSGKRWLHGIFPKE